MEEMDPCKIAPSLVRDLDQLQQGAMQNKMESFRQMCVSYPSLNSTLERIFPLVSGHMHGQPFIG
jgi:hypothetical protein